MGDGAASSNTTVVVQPGAEISTTDTAAISLGENSHITISGGANVHNTAGPDSTSPNYVGAGANTIEVGSGSTILVEQGGSITANGPAGDSEAINFFGTGHYELENNGEIRSANATMWFQGSSGSATIINNGTMEADIGGANPRTATVLGNNGGVEVDFTNRGNVIGSLSFGTGGDELHVYTGSSITGNISGGGGNDLFTLNSDDPLTASTFAPTSLSGFETLENHSGIWTLNVALPGSGITTTQVKGGTLILGQDATAYTGTMTVDGPGILQTSGEFAPNAITNNGLVRFLQPTNTVYDGVVSGTGRVDKTGAGKLTLTQNQTYTGGTSILAGTLELGDGGTTGGITGDVLVNGTLTFNRSDAVTFAGSISGTGGVNQNGTGTTIFTADNTYSAGTVISAGTLQLGNGGSTGSIVGTIANNGTLAVDRNNTLVLDSFIFGSGDLQQNGTGTTVLTADNTYTGGTTVNAGILQLGDGGTTGSIVGDVDIVTNSSVLAFNRSDDVTFSGSISGLGAVAQSGTGTTVLTADNTYTGGTTIMAGTLQLGNGGTTGSIGGNVVNNGTLAFNRSDDVTFAGDISGTGAVLQNGSGATILSGANSYSGATTVNSGTLRAGAVNVLSAGSAHTVASGATLDLNGFNQTIGALNNSGTVRLLSTAPGVQLTVNGNYVGNNGLLQMGTELGADGSPTDRLIISGSASGNTTLEVTNIGGLGALTTGNGIELVNVGGATTSNAFALAGGQVNAGAYEYRLFAGNASGAGSNWYLRTINNTVTAFRPEVALNAALPGLLAQSDLAMLGTLHQRIGDNGAATPAEEKRHVWGRVIGQRIKTDHGGDVSPSTEGSFSGLQVGSDLLQLGTHRFGVYGGYLHGDSDVRGFASGLQHNKVGNLDLDNKYLGAYWTFQNDTGWYTDTVLQYAWYDGETSSRGGADNDIEGNGTQLSFEVGKSIPLNATWMLEPQAQLIVGWMNIDGQQISGADIDQDTDTTLTSRLGLRLKGDYATSHGRMQPYGRFNVWHGSNGAYTMTFAGPAGSTDIRTERGYTSGQLALGLTWTVSDRVNVYGEVGHMFSLDNDEQQVRQPIMATVGLRMDW
ncbi:MAG TPA: autotransporter outer membrane beta-barrel domain-containing protein [Methylophilaceae bacterium]|nr:autotransporter outer membrane beta-barrel domain-containing protein [Methylophilaceae bacterium]